MNAHFLPCICLGPFKILRFEASVANKKGLLVVYWLEMKSGRAQPSALAVFGFGCFVPDLTRLPSYHARRPALIHFSPC